jgi:hypothetical protein
MSGGRYGGALKLKPKPERPVRPTRFGYDVPTVDAVQPRSAGTPRGWTSGHASQSNGMASPRIPSGGYTIPGGSVIRFGFEFPAANDTPRGPRFANASPFPYGESPGTSLSLTPPDIGANTDLGVSNNSSTRSNLTPRNERLTPPIDESNSPDSSGAASARRLSLAERRASVGDMELIKLAGLTVQVPCKTPKKKGNDVPSTKSTPALRRVRKVFARLTGRRHAFSA